MTNFEPKVDAKVDLEQHTLEDLAKAILPGLQRNFSSALVEVSDCPDLRQFGLACPAFGEKAHIADVGGPGNLFPVLRKDKVYTVDGISSLCDMPDDAFVIGPGAGPFKHVGVNSEMMCNCHVGKEIKPDVKTFIAKIDTEKDSYTQDKVACTDFALMANLLITSGAPSKVLHIRAKKRTGKENFTDSIRYSLAAEFGPNLVSLGGVFRLNAGKAMLHVMPDFPAENMADGSVVGKWLRYFDMNSPLTCLSVFHSTDPGLDLRPEHTHCFSEHGDAGHYHYDVTPDEVEYEGWFVPAQVLYRIDQIKDSS